MTVNQLPQIFAKSPDAPSPLGEACTPSDTVNATVPFRALWVGSTGNVAVVFSNDAVVTFVGVPSGFILPVSGRRVNATNTTATSIVYCF